MQLPKSLSYRYPQIPHIYYLALSLQDFNSPLFFSISPDQNLNHSPFERAIKQGDSSQIWSKAGHFNVVGKLLVLEDMSVYCVC